MEHHAESAFLTRVKTFCLGPRCSLPPKTRPFRRTMSLSVPTTRPASAGSSPRRETQYFTAHNNGLSACTHHMVTMSRNIDTHH